MTTYAVRLSAALLATATLLSCGIAGAETVSDDMTQAAAKLNWIPFNGACLTASTSAATSSSTIPGCSSIYSSYYQAKGEPSPLPGGTSGSLPDSVGQGALRFTGPHQGEGGAIISNFTFDASQGINATFTAVSYGGDSGGTAADGADGMSFFLMDGSLAAPTSIGATGGSLGYSCTNQTYFANLPPNGLTGAYVGLGLDEYGNFLNPGDNTASGPGVNPVYVGLRGAGSVNWNTLSTSSNTKAYYPSTLSGVEGVDSSGHATPSQRDLAVIKTCSTGQLWDYTKVAAGTATNPTQVLSGGSPVTIPDYAVITNGYHVIPGGAIADEGSSKRLAADAKTYNLKITSTGLLSLSVQANGGNPVNILTDQSITAANGTLPSTLRFGFAASTGGSTNIHEITCFQATPAAESVSSAGVNGQQASELQTGTQVYLAYFQPQNWWGQLVSQKLVLSTTTNQVVLGTINWDANCVLTSETGNVCPTNGSAVTYEPPASRTMLTWNGSQGVPFEWGNLTSAEQSALDPSASGTTSLRLNYLRGDRSCEQTSSGTAASPSTCGSTVYRARTGVLGDIVDSNPVWVGPPSAPYTTTWSDALNPYYAANSLPADVLNETAYSSFASQYVSRTNMVYVGSNDGFLHGFRSGYYDGNIATGYPFGNYVDIVGSVNYNDGQELLAYMPQAVLNVIHNATVDTADYSATTYAHAFYVDATPASGDLFYNGAWHTWLVGGLGPGGPAIYGLDVTNPGNFSESGSAPSTTVLGEISPATLSVLCGGTTCGNNLGNTYGTPQIRRMHNGDWAVIFGNGYGSSTQHAGIFIITISTAAVSWSGSSTLTAYFLDCGADPTGAGRANGIAYTTPVDLDGDHIVDYIYAGDILGNVWRFDVTSSRPSQWAPSTFSTATTPKPLFSTPTISGNIQPITTKLLVLSAPGSGTGTSANNRVLVVFGTGQETPATITSGISYAAGLQGMYGIWDWDLSKWSTQLNVAAPYAYLPETSTSADITYSYNSSNPNSGSPSLAYQTISLIPGTTYRTISGPGVCWAGTTGCTTNNQYGWVSYLPGANEQIVYNPIAYQGAILVNTLIPANNSTLSCTTSLPSGWTLAFQPEPTGATAGSAANGSTAAVTGNGGSFASSVFPNTGAALPYAQLSVTSNGVTVMESITGTQLNAAGSGSIVTNAGNSYLVNQTTNASTGVGSSSVGGTVTQINTQPNTTAKRLNWTQLR